MIALMLATMLSASAGTVFVNGTAVDGLKNFEFKDVDVNFDADGNVFIVAPHYSVAIGDAAETMRQNADITAPPAPPGDSDVPASTWWLVSEDNASGGQSVDVVVNGLAIQTVRSGGKQVVFDIGPYLKSGSNEVVFQTHDDSAPSGGAFFLYVGTGSVDGGKFLLDQPKITFKRNSVSPPGGASESHSLALE